MQANGERPLKRAVLVTGASSGIGKAVALYLAERGVHVYAGVRTQEAAEALVAARGDDAMSNGLIEPLMLDVTDGAQIADAVGAVSAASATLRLDGIVNNAGIAVAGPMEFLPLEDLRRQFEVNVLGHVAVTQAFLPLLRRSHGRIVFIGAVSGHVSSRLLGAYAASKFALEAVADALRLELHEWGLKVSVVEPGRVPTPIWSTSIDKGRERLARLPPEATDYYQGLVDSVFDGAKDASE
ncbi:MAG TPA: SDR family NAD(P)-dependent oxidoreductase, partial [Trueperaceae bacterium]|nr:SDR family NAD(P)-dependent oxidoreductase [Trueperaceae bacterium]